MPALTRTAPPALLLNPRPAPAPQNALDAFRAEEEMQPQPYTLGPEALAELASVGGQPMQQQQGEGGAGGGQGSEDCGGGLLRARRRKAPRGNSSFVARRVEGAKVGGGGRCGRRACARAAWCTLRLASWRQQQRL